MSRRSLSRGMGDAPPSHNEPPIIIATTKEHVPLSSQTLARESTPQTIDINNFKDSPFITGHPQALLQEVDSHTTGVHSSIGNGSSVRDESSSRVTLQKLSSRHGADLMWMSPPIYGSIPISVENEKPVDLLESWCSSTDNHWTPIVPVAKAVHKDRSHIRDPFSGLDPPPYGENTQNPPKRTDSIDSIGIPRSDSGYGSVRSYDNISVRSYELNSLRDAFVTGSFSGDWDKVMAAGHACPTCKKSFKTKSELKKHGFCRTKMLICSVDGCSRKESYGTSNDLDRHMKTKHAILTQKIRGYSCTVENCKSGEMIWFHLDNLRTHLKQVHNLHEDGVDYHVLRNYTRHVKERPEMFKSDRDNIIKRTTNPAADANVQETVVTALKSQTHKYKDESEYEDYINDYDDVTIGYGDVINNSYFPEIDSSSDPVSLRGKRIARSYDVPCDTPAPPSKRVKTMTCCNCSLEYPKHASTSCLSCNHEPCDSCELSSEMIIDVERTNSSEVGINEDRSNDLTINKYKQGVMERENAFENEREGNKAMKPPNEDVRQGAFQSSQKIISAPQETDNEERTAVPQDDTQKSANLAHKLGKASPYLPQSEDGDRESDCDSEIDFDESEMSDASCESIQPPSLDESKQRLFVKGSIAFWDVFNREFPAIVARCVDLATTCTNSKSNSKSSAKPQSEIKADTSSTGPSSFKLPAKRKPADDEPPPDDNRSQGPQQPDEDEIFLTKKRRYNFACPFRKHNPGKYTIHHPAWRICATTAFENVARTKEHLYRRHKIWQCLRCWLFFLKEEDLNIHLSVVDNICEVRTGTKPAVDGITPSVERQLRSRKCYKRVEEDRWRDLYGILFPDDQVPTPSHARRFGTVSCAAEYFIDEFMRQQVHRSWRSRWDEEVRNMMLGPLHDHIDTIVRRIIDQAQDDAVRAWRQQYSGNSSISDQYATPISLSPTQTRLGRASQVPSLTVSDFYTTNPQILRPSSPNPECISDHVSESTRVVEEYPRLETDQQIYNTDTDTETTIRNSLDFSGEIFQSSRPATGNFIPTLLRSDASGFDNVSLVADTLGYTGTTVNSSDVVFKPSDFTINGDISTQLGRNKLTDEPTAGVQQENAIVDVEPIGNEGFDWYDNEGEIDGEEMNFSCTWFDEDE